MRRKPRLRAPWLAAVLLAGLALAAGCAPVGPDYAPPRPQTPPAWHGGLGQGLSPSPPDAASLAAWWRGLGDPLLARLEAEALAGNLSLKQAMARVRQARAQRGYSQAALYPALDAGAEVQASRDSENVPGTKPDHLYAAGFDAGWELDVFGGVRRSVEAAQADLEAAQADQAAVLVSLTAEVALNYVEARTYQDRLATARANLAAQEHTYAFIRSRHQAGLINRLALEQARYNLEGTRSQIPTLETGLSEAGNRLAVLLGLPPGSLEKRLSPARGLPAPPASVAVGAPAEAIRRRPDIRRAERRLAAQCARVGVATADLYPRFRLLGSIGLEATDPGDLWRSASLVWGLLPTVSWRVFDAGAVRRNIEVQDAVQEQYLLAYEAAVLTALEEAENAAAGYVREQRRRASLVQAVAAAREAEGLSRDLFIAGLINFDSVLDAQRSLLSYQDQLAVSQGVVVGRLITLYKALGGGWQPLPEPPPAPVPAGD